MTLKQFFTTHILPGCILPGVLTALILFATSGCNRLSVKESLEDVSFNLTDQKNRSVTFPGSFKGKVLLVGYIYTSCPDICPLTTSHMQEVERSIDDDNVHFIAITFDPERDSPGQLASYAHSHKLNEEHWTLLTGERKTVYSLMEHMGIQTVKTPTSFTESGDPLYFIDHTDRVTLIDRESNVRRHYYGSRLDIETVIEDINTLKSI